MQRTAKRDWHSDAKIALPPWASTVFGPCRMKKFGKPEAITPRYALGSSPDHASASRLPPRPVRLRREAPRKTSNPVASTMMSAARSSPSAVRTPVSVMRSIGSVTSAQLGCLSALYQPLSSRMRLA